MVVFSGSVRVPGKARLAGNGLSPWPERRNAVQGRGPTYPKGARGMPVRCVAALAKGYGHCPRTAPYGRASRER